MAAPNNFSKRIKKYVKVGGDLESIFEEELRDMDGKYNLQPILQLSEHPLNYLLRNVKIDDINFILKFFSDHGMNIRVYKQKAPFTGLVKFVTQLPNMRAMKIIDTWLDLKLELSALSLEQFTDEFTWVARRSPNTDNVSIFPWMFDTFKRIFDARIGHNIWRFPMELFVDKMGLDSSIELFDRVVQQRLSNHRNESVSRFIQFWITGWTTRISIAPERYVLDKELQSSGKINVATANALLYGLGFKRDKTSDVYVDIVRDIIDSIEYADLDIESDQRSIAERIDKIPCLAHILYKSRNFDHSHCRPDIRAKIESAAAAINDA